MTESICCICIAMAYGCASVNVPRANMKSELTTTYSNVQTTNCEPLSQSRIITTNNESHIDVANQIIEQSNTPQIDTTHMLQNATQAMANGAVLSYHAARKYIKIYEGMPKAVRQVPGKYWVGTRPDENSIKVMQQNHIKLVVSASRMPQKDLEKLKHTVEQSGMVLLHVPYGSKFPKPERFIDTIHEYDPDEIYIFCDHGADRSGGMLAYLLVTEHGFTVPQAFYSIVYPVNIDIRGLENVLIERGYAAPSKQYSKWIGIYSAQKNGGIGGYKCHAEKYVSFTNSVIDAMEASIKPHKHNKEK